MRHRASEWDKNTQLEEQRWRVKNENQEQTHAGGKKTCDIEHVWESNKINLDSEIENDSDDGFWHFDMDKVINAYHIFENQKPGLDKLLEEKEVSVPPP